jgi:cyclopropane-fatty-acyl-phospholipid synthase
MAQTLLRQPPAVRALGFDDRFVRTWDFYLASCEALFRTRAIRDMQLVLGRPFEAPA